MTNTNISSLTVRANGMNLGWESKGPVKLGQVEIPDDYYNRIYTGIETIDNLFNGFVPGQIITLGASRGCGKTTLLMQISQAITDKYEGRVKSLFLSNEEDVTQLAFTAERIGTQGIAADNCTYVEDVIAAMGEYKFITVDSLAGLQTRNDSVNRSDVEVYCIQQIYRAAKASKCVVGLIQHMAKAGKVALGKAAVEHTADACIKMSNLDPEDFPRGKKIVVEKNRMGNSGELWLKMERNGFDFSNPIEDKTGNDKEAGKGEGGQRAIKKIAEMNALIAFMKSQGQIKEADIAVMPGLPSDPTGYDRITRLLKGLVKMGKVVKVGNEYSVVA
jgi:predicted ATP-dependent serine protease